MAFQFIGSGASAVSRHLLLALLCVLGVAVFPCKVFGAAWPQQKPGGQDIVGAWQLIVTSETMRDGTVRTDANTDSPPSGYVVYDASQYMCLLLNHVQWEHLGEPGALYSTSSYCGRWRISEGGTVVLHLTAVDVDPARTKLLRAPRFELQGDVLLLHPIIDQPDVIERTLTFVRVSSTSRARTFRDCSECPEMVVVPPGRFQMGGTELGDPRDPSALPMHRVTLARSFAVGRYKVSRGEFARFAAATMRSIPDRCFGDGDIGADSFAWQTGRNWRDPGYKQTDFDPVVCVSWNDAQDYVRWLSSVTGKSYRLLSEAEWEYVYRGGTSTPFWWGDSAELACRFGNIADLAFNGLYAGKEPFTHCLDGYVVTAPGGAFPSNPFGIYDLVGNTWEWVADCYHSDYDGAPIDGRAWTTGDCNRRGRRAGSWYRPARKAWMRSFLDGDGWHFNAGFRIAMDQ